MRRHFLLLCLELAPVCTMQASSTAWKGGAANLNWNTSGNWTNGIPTATSDVVFLTNGVVLTSASNNVVSASTVVQSLSYKPANSSTGPQTYQNTFIYSGVTLTVSNVLATNAVFVGSGLALANSMTSASISGPNGSLWVIATNGVVNVRQGGSGNFSGMAALDLSGLSNCAIRAQRVLVAGDGTNGSGEKDRASGTLRLARTSSLFLSGGSFPPALTVGYNIGNGSGTNNLLLLGQTNYIFCDSGLGVGIGRNPCQLKFGGFANSWAMFRDTAGTGRQAVWLVGDSSSLGYWGNYSSGTNDFSGGAVDAQVALVVVGRSVNGTANPSTGGNDGALILNDGVLDAHTIVVGYQVNDYCARVGGFISVDGIARVQVNNAIQLGRFMASAASNGVSSAVLSIGARSGGGAVTVNGGITTTTSSKNNTNNSQIVVRNGGSLSVKGKLGPLSYFELSNCLFGLDFGTGTNPSTPVCVTTNLVTGSPIALTIAGSGLTPGPITLIKYGSFTNGLADFATLTLPDQVQGYLSNNTANASIELVITQSNPVSNVPPVFTPRLSGGPVYADYDKVLLEPAPRADGYTHVDTPGLIARLVSGNIKTYAFLVWRNNTYRTDWDDFRLEFLPAAQAAGIDVYLYLTPPTENSPPAGYVPFGDDYYSWAAEAGRLAQRYPALKAMVIDDFNSNLRLFTPDYVGKIMEGAHVYCTNLMFMPINYDLTKGWASPTAYTSPAFMNAYGPYCGAVMFAYLNWANHDDFSNEAFQIAHNSGIVRGDLSQLLVALPSSRATQAGDYAALAQVLTNSAGFPEAPYDFTFRVAGYPSNSASGYHQLQVLVDSDIVWSKDFSAAYGVQDISTNLQPWLAHKTSATLTVRVYEQSGVANYWIRPSWILPAGNWVPGEKGGLVGTSTYYPGTPRGVPMMVMIYDWMYGTGGNNSSNYVYNANMIAQASVQAGQTIGIIQFELDKSTASPLFPIIQQLYGQWAYTPRFDSITRLPDGGARLSGNSGGPNIGYTLKAANSPVAPMSAWSSITSSAFDSSGRFTNTDASAAGQPSRFYRLSVP
jgi:hypothetical protein